MEDRWLQPELQGDVRVSSAKRMKQAWRNLGIATLLLSIAAIAYSGLRSGHDSQMRAVYIWILWLFIGRFVWSVWKYLRARRDVNAFRTGVERQLKVTGTPKD